MTTHRPSARPRRGVPAVLAAALAALLVHSVQPAAAEPWPDGDPWSTGAWRSYVLAPEGGGPDGRTVAPAAVLGSGSTRQPEALLAPGGPAARLTRTLRAGSARWPDGTTAAASSELPSHPAGAAVDGDADTWWQDSTRGVRPDTLTITTPRPVTLPGVTLVSSSRGWVQDARVEAKAGGGWRQVGEISGAGTLTAPVTFDTPVTTTALRVTVRRAWASESFPLRQRESPKLVDVVPGVVEASYVDLDFGREVAGRLQVTVRGASRAAPAVRVAVAETRADLGPRSDYSRSDYGPDVAAGGGDEGPGTDQFVPDPDGQVWTDTAACQHGDRVCSEGVRAFRYTRVYLGTAVGDGAHTGDFGHVDVDAVALEFTPFLGTPDTYDGWFLSSDDLLNRAWYASVYTAELVTDTFRRDDVDPRGCAHADLEGKVFYMDGAKRDRCPYGGGADIAMLASYVAHPDPAPITNQLHAFAERQGADGWIPGSPIMNFGIRYPDAPGRWVTELHKYALWSGDLEFVRDHWDTLTGVLDTWYPQLTDDRGLAASHRALSARDRTLAARTLSGGAAAGLYVGDLLISTEAVVALRNGAQLAEALGGSHAASATRWRARADQVSAAINRHLWDPAVGAYRQSLTRGCHPQWNALTVLAGVAGPGRADQALDYLQSLTLPYGNPYNDDAAACPLFGGDTAALVYGEGGAWETLARFRAGRDTEALDQLRRTYGWQLARDPGTVWEGWGAPGGDPSALFGRSFTSLAHGHMAGAAPVLTSAVLGVTPTWFEFDRYRLAPHPGDLTSARGVVPTPHGPIRAAWRRDADAGRFDLAVSAPAGTTGRVGVPTFGRPVQVLVDGEVVWDGTNGHAPGVRGDGRYVWLEELPAGSHRISGRELGGAGRDGDDRGVHDRPGHAAGLAPAPGRNRPASWPSGRPRSATWVPRRNAATTAPRTLRPA